IFKDLKELAEYDQTTSTDRPIFLNDNEDHPVQNKESPENFSEENVVLKTNQEPPQDSDIHQLIEECSIEVPEEQKQKMEDTIITPEMESDEVTESNAKNLLPIPSECEVTSEDKRECDELVCNNHSDTFFDSKIDDDISVYVDDFEDIEYVEASLSNPEIVSVDEENVVQQEEEEVDFEDISQIQDVVLREKLLSITDNSLLDNFSPEFETFCDHSEETRSGNTTHANYSLPEYDSFCFEIEPNQEMLINLVENDNSDSSNDPFLEEVDLFLSDNS
nr:hypothetical protein [Tanacetum cinerariifolium]